MKIEDFVPNQFVMGSGTPVRPDVDEFSLGLVKLQTGERVTLAIQPPRLPFKLMRIWFRQSSTIALGRLRDELTIGRRRELGQAW